MPNKGLRINLIPPEIYKKRKAEKGLLVLLAAVALFITLLLGVTFLFGIKVTQEEAALSEMQAKTAVIDSEIAKYDMYKERKEAVGKHEESIRKALDKQLFWHRFLNELSMIVPANVSISSLDMTNSQVSLSAVAYTHQDVAEFLVRMMDLDELTDVWIDGSKDAELEAATYLGQSDSGSSDSGSGSSTSSSGSGAEGVEFTITAKLKNPGPSAEGATGTTGQPTQTTGGQ